MLNANSHGDDWLSATPSERRLYVVTACRGISEHAIGDAVPEIVLEGMNKFFESPENLKWKVSYGFGLISVAVLKTGDYHGIL